jgi:hypothetical protein
MVRKGRFLCVPKLGSTELIMCRDSIISVFRDELETSVKCLCSQLVPLSVYVQSRSTDEKPIKSNILQFQNSMEREFERGDDG